MNKRYAAVSDEHDIHIIPEDSLDYYYANYRGIIEEEYNSSRNTWTDYVYVYESDSDSIALNQLYQDINQTSYNLRQAQDDAYRASVPLYQAALEKMILDEEALEGMFEGYRFFDLMRYAMYYNDPDFIANQVARRKGAAEYDSRADALKGGKWYLPLP